MTVPDPTIPFSTAQYNPIDMLALSSKLDQMNIKFDQVSESIDTQQQDVRIGLIPVKVSELMKGFQAAIVKANNAVMSQSELEQEQSIEYMGIKNLEVSLVSQIVEDGHQEDPMILIPTSNSTSTEKTEISLTFSIVGLPKKE